MASAYTYIHIHWYPGLLGLSLKHPLDLLLDDCLHFSCGTWGFLQDFVLPIQIMFVLPISDFDLITCMVIPGIFLTISPTVDQKGVLVDQTVRCVI